MKKIVSLIFLIILLMAFIIFNELKTYTIKFDSTGGDIVEPMEGISKGEIVVLPTPAKENYEFLYWYRFVDKEAIIVNNGTQVYDNLNLYAKWDKKKYTVTFIDENDMIFDIQTVLHGENAIEPESVRNFDYFDGWDKEFKNVKSDLVVKAIYNFETFKVEFLDYTNSVVKTQLIEHGKSATAPVLNERIGYTFIGWDKDLTKITENVQVKPVYQIKKYKVYFIKDEKILEIQEVKHGSSASEPNGFEKEGYTLLKWDKDFTNITSDLIVNAEYKINTYKVKFLDHENKVVDEQIIEHGKPATRPTIQSRLGYTFIKWSHEFNIITKDLKITPIYEKNQYKVKFVDYNGNIVKSEIVFYNESATAPILQERIGHTFLNWSIEFTNVTEDLEVVANYKVNSYNVKFLNYDGTVLKEELVEYKKAATAPIPNERIGYSFIEWNKDFNNITEDIEINPVYKINIYTVTFKNYNGTTLDKQYIEHGAGATEPDKPIITNYTFDKWDKDFSNVTSDLEVKALYINNDVNLIYLDFEIVDNEAYITNYSKNDIDRLVIPDTIIIKGKEYKITKIKQAAFMNSPLETIEIGKYVTEIERYAFFNCINLYEITLPDGLVNIGESAFMSCISLRTITIPESVYIIDNRAFFDCVNLTIYCNATFLPPTWSKTFKPDEVIIKFR